ncbi:glycan-binding surface protein [Hymenobacter bucti]|uniref:Glycan-binding surface protein n=1 Tax=Hymenobacter bucti TaxID=1844114 RepID=A0ABW4QZT8_9BACT
MNLYSVLPKAALGLALAGTLALTGCKKDDTEVCGGTPALTSVTSTTDRTQVSTSGNLADWIIVKGTNLCNVSQLSFNDVDVSLADAYITATEITVQIPRVVPKKVTNTITVTTAGGTAQTAYTLSVPAMSVTSMANEYAAPGQKAAIVGSNFDLYEVTPTKGKVLWNGTALAVTKTTADSVYFVVPANATPGATLKVVDANGKETAVPGRYKDNRNILFGYDTNGSVWGGNTFITTGPMPAPVNGPYVRVSQSIGAWTWTEFSTNNNIALPADVIANPGNYVMRFEVNTLKAFNTNAIRFSIDGDVAANNTYTWTPTSPFNTRGQWSTMTVPLSGFINKKADLDKPLHECKFVFLGDGALDADISFDNFRIVPKG